MQIICEIRTLFRKNKGYIIKHNRGDVMEEKRQQLIQLIENIQTEEVIDYLLQHNEMFIAIYDLQQKPS